MARAVLFVRDGQIYRYRVGAAPATADVGQGARSLTSRRGARNSDPNVVAGRQEVRVRQQPQDDHSFIAVYDTVKRAISVPVSKRRLRHQPDVVG